MIVGSRKTLHFQQHRNCFRFFSGNCRKVYSEYMNSRQPSAARENCARSQDMHGNDRDYQPLKIGLNPFERNITWNDIRIQGCVTYTTFCIWWPKKLPLLTLVYQLLHLIWVRENRYWVMEDKHCVAWSDELHFQLIQGDDQVRMSRRVFVHRSSLTAFFARCLWICNGCEICSIVLLVKLSRQVGHTHYSCFDWILNIMFNIQFRITTSKRTRYQDNWSWRLTHFITL